METKKCTKCKEDKVLEDFVQYNSKKEGRVIYFGWCKDCKARYDLTRNQRNKNLVASHGLEECSYLILLNCQDGVCKICKQPPTNKPLFVDHCHKNNIIRGLLCHSCNIGLSNFKDNPELFREAARYLEEFEERHATNKN